PQERVILVCQDISNLDELANYLSDDTPVRAIERSKLKEDLIFYCLQDKKWVLDVPEKTVKIKPKKPKIVRHQQKALLP
ncbi:MAG: hypothetical protein GX984_06730, partial [Erysipelothrix sp.]|nr:hypothetical protein [Erysipelothrix sp.]